MMTAPPHNGNSAPGRSGPIRWMAGHSVSANLLMLVLLIGGFLMAGKIKKEVFPDFELVAVPGCGHRVLLENPRVIEQIVMRYQTGP